jgi:hypothetical protein
MKEEGCVCGEYRRQYHKYSAMIFSVESERLRLMRSESNDMIKKPKKLLCVLRLFMEVVVSI